MVTIQVTDEQAQQITKALDARGHALLTEPNKGNGPDSGVWSPEFRAEYRATCAAAAAVREAQA